MNKSLWALALLLLFSHAGGASAVTQYWDVNGATAGFGGTGTWDVGGAPNWNDSTGTGAPAVWANGNDAVFQGPAASAGTVTMGAGVVAGSVTVDNTGGTYVFSGGNLTLSSFTTSTTTGLNTNFTTNVSGTDITLINPNTAARTGVVNFNSATNSFTGTLNFTGAGTPTSAGFRLQVNLTQVGAIPATANINFTRNFSQLGFNAVGTHNFSNNFNLNTSNIPGTFESWIGFAGSNIVNLSGVISGNSTLTFGLAASGGAGVLTLNNNNTYTGATRFLHAPTGVVALGVNDAFPTGAALSFGSGATNVGSLDLNGKNQTVASLASASTTGTQNGIVNTQGATATSVLTINGAASTTYTGPLGSAGNATNLPNAADHHKIQLVLHASNTGTLTMATAGGVAYSGGTIINGGKIYANNTTGSGTGTGPVTVNSGGTLGGTGSVSGAVTVNTGGTLAPGMSIESLDVGTLTFAAVDAALAMEIDLNDGSPMFAADLLNVIGGLTLGGATLQLSVTNVPAGPGSYTFLLVTNDDVDGVLGTFGSVTGVPGGYSAIIDYTYSGTDVLSRSGTGNDIAITLSLAAVPEASAFLFLGLTGAAVGLICGVRRSRQM